MIALTSRLVLNKIAVTNAEIREGGNLVRNLIKRVSVFVEADLQVECRGSVVARARIDRASPRPAYEQESPSVQPLINHFHRTRP